MDLSALFSALLMGIVEGFTEFLPISSTGHLILLGELIGFQGPPGKVFEISIQLGAILAVCWIYRALIVDLLRGMWRPGRERYYVINPWVVSIALILGGIAIIAIEKLRPAPSIHSVPEIGPLAAVLVGLGQALAMIPGTSRSGATIITALLIGVERRTAAEFSFVLAIPTMFAASFYSLWKVRSEIDPSAFGQIAVGFIAAFIVAFITVRAVLALIGRIGFTPFGYYRLALGSLMLLVLALR
jgi:undecaprenyl-diphosphatase